MKWINIEGFGILGQIRILVLLIFMIISTIGIFILMILKFSQGENFVLEFVSFVLLLIFGIGGMIFFIKRHQNSLNQIEMERKKLDEERKQFYEKHMRK